MIRKLISVMIIIVLVICMAGCTSSNNMADSAVKAAKQYGIEEVADLGELFKAVSNTSDAYFVGSGEESSRAYADVFNSSNSLPQKEVDKVIFVVVFEKPNPSTFNRCQCTVVVFKDSKDASEIYGKCIESMLHKDGVSSGEDKGLSYTFERDEKGTTATSPMFRGFYLKDNCVIKCTCPVNSGDSSDFCDYFLKKMELKS